MKRLFSEVYLHLIAGVIALGILGISAHTLWIDRQNTWQEAEKSSRNVLTTIARDLEGKLDLLDLSLRGAMEGLRYLGSQQLPPDLQYRMLFDRTATASFMGTLLVVDQAGNLIADAGPMIAPRALNVADREYFIAHKANNHIGLYISRPFASRTRQGDTSIGISRKLSDQAGRFAGVVMGSMPLTTINQLFNNLSLGQHGAINLFRNDGILLTRYPYDESQVDQDLGGSPHVRRLLAEKSGTFDSVSPIDGVRRIISFERLERYPLVLTVALSVEEVFSAWQRKALVLSLATLVLCCAVVGLTVLFQRELKRRTRAETKLRRIARTDDLTGLPNRRAFRETFEREWRHAVRSGSALSLLYIDADYFKNFNDHYGHGRGDEALRAVASTLESNIRRPRDVAVRHGGEEFAIVLPETDLQGAKLIAENIRQSIVALSITHEGSPYQVVTVSIGIASVNPSRESDRATLLEAADRALYAAKAAGRNCVHHRESEADPQQKRLPHAAA
ncbi:sensor domain-containing diguanylate cyclase [Microvirga calopogonii]|uniref:sensor domain-containing diguanylate cyclase n=1 Tax=Microvirga calopogonii TaxID=2078013 RepID=UPI000E0DC144|nr:diguanylate cyclase [Microvirga calopogonii]